uniref:TS3 protein n=1 Tax=Trypanosoma congolense TaxID=5692 RepID=W0YKF6_TRYCO|nr:TS3 protein [Trypanosoma congolense]
MSHCFVPAWSKALCLLLLSHCLYLAHASGNGRTTRELFLGGGHWVVGKECLAVNEEGSAARTLECNGNCSPDEDSQRRSADDNDGLQEETINCVLEPRSKQLGVAKDMEGKHVVDSFRIPSIVEVDGVLITVSDVRYLNSNDLSFIDTVARYSADGGRTWETEVIIKNARVNAEHSRVVDPTVVVKNNTIFVLVGRYNKSDAYWTWQGGGGDWDILMHKGTVTKSLRGGKPSVNIEWDEPQNLKYLLSTVGKIDGRSLIQYIGGVGNCVVTPNGTIVLPVQVLNTNRSVMAMIIYSTDEGESWQFSKSATPVGTTESSIVWWDDKLLLNGRTNNDLGYRKVYESSDLGTTWTEVVGTISRVIGNSPGRNQPGSSGSSIAITLEGMRVMLITQPKNIKGSWHRDRLQLWLTDGNRVWLVGQISEGDDNGPYSSLLYTSNGTLYCLYEQDKAAVLSIYLIKLEDELESIKSIVKLWKDQDALLSGNCSSPDGDYTEGCVGIPTAGLVGLLSGPSDEDVWHDAYRCVDASVENVVNVADGLQLSGWNSSRVLWPVSSQGQDQKYHFANVHFTLVANLRLVGAPKGDFSLVGFEMYEGETRKTVKLSAIKSAFWEMCHTDLTTRGSRGSLPCDEVHQVALTLRNGVISVYANGRHLSVLDTKVAGANELLNISNFFVGHPGVGGALPWGSAVVRDVLLYNRPLHETELESLYLNGDVIKVVNHGAAGISAARDAELLHVRGDGGDKPDAVPLKLAIITGDGVVRFRGLYQMASLVLLGLMLS